MGRSKKDFHDWIDSKIADVGLDEANAILIEELRKALNLKDRPKPKKVNVRYGAKSGKFERFLVIPDCQVAPGTPTDHLEWTGRYIAEKRPDVIVNLGDFWDLPSLSSYESDVAKAAAAVDVVEDIEAGNVAMERLTAPYRKVRGYHPEEHFLYGNHEDRLRRYIEQRPELRTLLTEDRLNLDGWKVHRFLDVVTLRGIAFSHYFANPMSGRPIGGTAHNLLRQVGRSCIMGHRQVLDCAVHELPEGKRRRALICGAHYPQRLGYKGPQGNGHFRGMMVLNEVRNGMWDQMEVSIDFLRRKYA